MFSYVVENYVKLTPKAKVILAVLISDCEENDSDGLTRQQIAIELRQRRLYPHDDRAIKRLEAIGFIYIYREQLRHALARQWDDYTVLLSKDISLYAPYHRHSFNEDYYGYLVPLLKTEGIYREPDYGYVGDLIKEITTAWNNFRAIFRRNTQ